MSQGTGQRGKGRAGLAEGTAWTRFRGLELNSARRLQHVSESRKPVTAEQPNNGSPRDHSGHCRSQRGRGALGWAVANRGTDSW